MSGPGKNDNLNKRIMEFGVTFLGFIIELDILVKKITAAKEQRDLADDFPYLNLLFVNLIHAQQKLRDIFLEQFNKEFNIPGISYQNMIKLFSLSQDAYDKPKVKKELEEFKYFNTSEGRDKIITLLSTLFSNQEFAHSLINTAGLSTDLKKFLDENRDNLLHKRRDAEDKNVYAIFYPKNAQDDSFIFAMQAVLRFPLLSGDLLKEVDAENSLHEVATKMLKDTKKIGVLANGMQVDYGAFNLNPADLLDSIDELSKEDDVRNPKNSKTKSLLQFVKLLSMTPVVLDKAKIENELSMAEISRLKQMQEIFASFGTTSAERINYITEQLSAILKSDSFKNFIPQIQSALVQTDKVVVKSEKKVGKPIPASKALFDANNKDIEYLINRYLQSFTPPFSKVDFYTANYILNYLRANDLKLTNRSIVTLEQVGDRNTTAIGKVASKVFKIGSATANAILSSAASKPKDEDSSDEGSPSGSADEKALYRRALNKYLKAHKEINDNLLKILTSYESNEQAPPLPPRPKVKEQGPKIPDRSSQELKVKEQGPKIPDRSSQELIEAAERQSTKNSVQAAQSTTAKPQITFMPSKTQTPRASLEKTQPTFEASKQYNPVQKTIPGSFREKIQMYEDMSNKLKQEAAAAKQRPGGQGKHSLPRSDNSRAGSGNFGASNKDHPGSKKF